MTGSGPRFTAERVREEYREFVVSILPLVADNYFEFVFSFPRSFYAERVDMAGLERVERVLDAGAGYGQWSVELAARCELLEGIDLNPNMTDIATRYARCCGVTNAHFSTQSIGSLAFPDEYFDFVWCWGVLMFGPIEDYLRELARVLKPGGKIVVGCLNARGRWLRKAWQALNASPVNRPLLGTCVQALVRGHRENVVPNYTTTSMAPRRCRAAGLELLACTVDGQLDLAGRSRRIQAFAPKFLCCEENIEFLARKPLAGRAR